MIPKQLYVSKELSPSVSFSQYVNINIKQTPVIITIYLFQMIISFA